MCRVKDKSLRFAFRKANVEKDEIVGALRELLRRLEDEA